MKKYITLAALLVAGSAFANAALSGHWEFNRSLESASDAAVNVTLAQKERVENTSTNEQGQEVTTITVQSGTLSYVDSLDEGTVLGEFTLGKDLGSAISLDSKKWLSVGSAAWSGTSQDYSLCLEKSFTFMSYVKFDSVDGEQFLFGTGSGNGAGIAFGIQNKKLDVLLKGKTHNTIANYEVSANTWMHLAFSYDAQTKNVVVYVNGSAVTEGTGLSLAGKEFASVGTNLGAAIGSASQDLLDLSGKPIQGSFAGALDDIRIYNEALTQKDILKAASLIPEPSAFGLLAGLGALALVGVRRRRR